MIKGKPQFIYEVRSYRFHDFDEDKQRAWDFASQMALYTETQFTIYKYVDNRYKEVVCIVLRRKRDVTL